MMRLRAGLSMLLLACLPAAWADSVSVTTVVDEDNVAVPGSVDTGCSLREAVHFMELGAHDRKAGYGGCFASTSTGANVDTVVVPSPSSLDPNATAYQLRMGEIVVRASVAIDGTPSALLTDTTGTLLGADITAAKNIALYPVIKAAPGSRLFTVQSWPAQYPNSSAAVPQPPLGQGTIASLTLIDLKLVGCGAQCANNGGIIDDESRLTITTSSLSNGAASLAGGAVFVGPTASLMATGTAFEQNSAGHGAAIALAVNDLLSLNSIQLTASSITGNSATDAGGAALEIRASQIGSGSFVKTTTISDNFAIGLRMALGLYVRNATIVNNYGGIDFAGLDLSQPASGMYNSLVVGNNNAAGSGADCINPSQKAAFGAITTYLYNVLGQDFSGRNPSACNALDVPGNNNLRSTGAGLQAVIADDGHGGCLPANRPGMLCPLSNQNGASLTRFHVPRLFTTATSNSAVTLLSDQLLNLIANRGAPAINANAACEANDQRGKNQRVNSCDIGAIAIQSPTPVSLTNTGLLGQVMSFDFVASTGDADLLPASACNQVAAPGVSPSTSVGCYKVLNAPAKGSVYIDQNTHQLVYTPASNFYGSDTFSLLVATTLSRFGDSATDPTAGQFVQVNFTVQTHPAKSATSSSVSPAVSLGGAGLLHLFALAALTALRRLRGRDK